MEDAATDHTQTAWPYILKQDVFRRLPEILEHTFGLSDPINMLVLSDASNLLALRENPKTLQIH